MTTLILAAALRCERHGDLLRLLPDNELALVPNVNRMTFWDGDGALSALENFLQGHPMQ
jgi:hypothetical protein